MNFEPTHIIFSATTECNLRCPHCFVSRGRLRLQAGDAIRFLESVRSSALPHRIQRIGFSGGEPFLYPAFITEVTKAAVRLDFLFDRLMTNADWWSTEAELEETLRAVYEAGYDGKIGISFDSFHAQKPERTAVFIKKCWQVFGAQSVELQCVLDKQNGTIFALHQLADALGLSVKMRLSRRTRTGTALLLGKGLAGERAFVPASLQPQTHSSQSPLAWKGHRWFKDDFCTGPGNVLFIHPDGNIAPCCGFANENPALFIGTITSSLDTVLQNAAKNRMIDICFSQGLGRFRRELRAQGVQFPGKCAEICAFCDFACKFGRNQ